MKSLFEELGETYPLGEDGINYPYSMTDESEHRLIGKWDRMHKAYLEEEHRKLYERLFWNCTLRQHLANVNKMAEAMMEFLTERMKKQEGITERLKAEQPKVWVGRMNSILEGAFHFQQRQ